MKELQSHGSVPTHSPSATPGCAQCRQEGLPHLHAAIPHLFTSIFTSQQASSFKTILMLSYFHSVTSSPSSPQAWNCIPHHGTGASSPAQGYPNGHAAGMQAYSKALTGQAEMFSGAEAVALKPPKGDLVHRKEPHLTGLSSNRSAPDRSTAGKRCCASSFAASSC